MALNLSQKIIQQHLADGEMKIGKEIALTIDQTLTQDATGTLVMLELEAMGLDRVKTELSAQYVDHNLIQEDFRNPDDHLFLESACERFGVWFSRPGNGVSHPVHMQYFGKPGKSLLGSDSHSCAAGSLGMLAIGAGGIDVAMAMAGFPFYVKMPKIFGIKLIGKFPVWVSAKDLILEILRRHSVKGGVGCILEYYGSGVNNLTAMERHVIANMGAELGATTSIFPSDKQTQKFLKGYDREKDWQELKADNNADYDLHDEIDLSKLEPLIALPSSPDKVVPVSKVSGKEIYQSYIGSSANPGYRDFAISAMMVKDKQIHTSISFDINPTSRDLLEELVHDGYLSTLIHAGARIHQAGCNGCIGMGQAPASGRNSLRTVPRNFPGRSGTKEDSVFLCSPETATASALTGIITDPRSSKIPYPKIKEPKKRVINKAVLEPLLLPEKARKVKLVKGPNIVAIPKLAPVPNQLEIPVLLKVKDNISTDEIMPAGARVLPFRSNIPKISEFVYERLDETYVERAKKIQKKGQEIVAGENYGQGSSREHAALAPRFLGLHVVIAKSFARIHWQNLINFGILPLNFIKARDYNKIKQGDIIILDDIHNSIKYNDIIKIRLKKNNKVIELKHTLSKRQVNIILEGGLINWARKQLTKKHK